MNSKSHIENRRMNKKMIKKMFIFFLIALFAVGVVSASNLRIFVTEEKIYANINGNLSNADSLCRDDANHPGDGIFKAILGTTNRQTGGSDWVMKPNTEYYKVDGTTLIDTTGNDGCFTYNLNNSITPYSNSKQVYTGLYSNCSVADNCNGWAEGGTGAQTRLGVSSETGSHVLYFLDVGCAAKYPIYCVEQQCVPDCEEKVCGDDGCDGSCGTCDVGTCNSSGVCEIDGPEFSTTGALIGILALVVVVAVFIIKKH